MSPSATRGDDSYFGRLAAWASTLPMSEGKVTFMGGDETDINDFRNE